MRGSWFFNLLLLSACCLVGRISAAQKSAVVPLVPRQPAVQVLAEPTGVPITPTHSTFAPAGASARPSAAPSTRLPEPVVVLNNKVLGALAMLKPQEMKDIIIYRSIRDAPPQWRDLLGSGMLAITLKQKVRVKSWRFAHLAHRLKLRGPVTYSFNGLPVSDARLRIALQAIGKINLTCTAAGTTLAVSTPLSPEPTYRPGTIMIRGTASR